MRPSGVRSNTALPNSRGRDAPHSSTSWTSETDTDHYPAAPMSRHLTSPSWPPQLLRGIHVTAPHSTRCRAASRHSIAERDAANALVITVLPRTRPDSRDAPQKPKPVPLIMGIPDWLRTLHTPPAAAESGATPRQIHSTLEETTMIRELGKISAVTKGQLSGGEQYTFGQT